MGETIDTAPRRPPTQWTALEHAAAIRHRDALIRQHRRKEAAALGRKIAEAVRAELRRGK